MSVLHVLRKVCIAPFPVRSKVDKFTPHMDGSNADFAPHMEGSHADFAVHMEGSHADFAVHMELRHSFRDQIMSKLAIFCQFSKIYIYIYINILNLTHLCDHF